MILAIKLVYEQRLLLTCGGLNGLMISPNDGTIRNLDTNQLYTLTPDPILEWVENWMKLSKDQVTLSNPKASSMINFGGFLIDTWSPSKFSRDGRKWKELSFPRCLLEYIND